MISFYTYDANGQIHSTGQCPEGMVYLQEREGLFVGVGVVDASRQFVSNGDLEFLPARPSAHHVFDYTTKTWEDPRSLKDFQQAAYKLIEAWRNKEENKGFTFSYAGKSWDAGLITRQRLQPVVNLSQLPDGFFWTDADNNDVPMTLPELIALSAAHEQALVLKGFEIHAQQRAMKNAVEAATSKEAVESIVIDL